MAMSFFHLAEGLRAGLSFDKAQKREIV